MFFEYPVHLSDLYHLNILKLLYSNPSKIAEWGIGFFWNLGFVNHFLAKLISGVEKNPIQSLEMNNLNLSYSKLINRPLIICWYRAHTTRIGWIQVNNDRRLFKSSRMCQRTCWNWNLLQEIAVEEWALRMETSPYAGLHYWAVTHIANEVSFHIRKAIAAAILGFLVSVLSTVKIFCSHNWKNNLTWRLINWYVGL